MEIIIAHPKNKEQLTVLKTIMKALRMDFEITKAKDMNDIRSWDDLPKYVQDGIKRGQDDVDAGRIKSHEEVMKKYAKYL